MENRECAVKKAIINVKYFKDGVMIIENRRVPELCSVCY
jgi:hypothetical protein